MAEYIPDLIFHHVQQTHLRVSSTMTSYHDGRPIFRNGLIEKAVSKRRISDELPAFASQYIPSLPPATDRSSYSRPQSTWEPYWHHAKNEAYWFLRSLGSRLQRSRPRDLLDIRVFFIILWALLLWWGEENTFRRKIQDCDWDRWETWVSHMSRCTAENRCNIC